jgi:uncharacterized protein (TIGR02246 family)
MAHAGDWSELYHHNPLKETPMRRIVAILSLSVCVAATVIAAQPKATRDAAGVKAAAAAYVAAYNRGDAKAVAAFWCEKGQWINPAGEKVEGRAAIEREMKSLFAQAKGMHLEIVESTVRLISPDVALEEGRVRVTQSGAEPENSTYIAIQKYEDGAWKLDTVRETEIPNDSAAPDSPLDELAWLVGQWGDTSPDADISTTVTWTKNKTFLHYSFKISVAGETDDLEGTQVIGWDPANQTIRSWMFDSDGGFGEGTWSKDENRWIIKFKQTMPDGRRASATNIYTITDANNITWQSIGREIDGKFMPNVGPFKIKRKSEAAAAAPTAKAAAKAATK